MKILFDEGIVKDIQDIIRLHEKAKKIHLSRCKSLSVFKTTNHFLKIF